MYTNNMRASWNHTAISVVGGKVRAEITFSQHNLRNIWAKDFKDLILFLRIKLTLRGEKD